MARRRRRPDRLDRSHRRDPGISKNSKKGREERAPSDARPRGSRTRARAAFTSSRPRLSHPRARARRNRRRAPRFVIAREISGSPGGVRARRAAASEHHSSSSSRCTHDLLPHHRADRAPRARPRSLSPAAAPRAPPRRPSLPPHARERDKNKKKIAARRVPTWSPTVVLTPPERA